jgi:PAS domain S-box-containing protein
LFQDNDRKFQLLFEEHPQPMWLMDSAGLTILEANAAAEALYGHTREQFRGMSLDAVLLNEESDQPIGTRRHRTANGRIIDVEMTQRRIDLDGHPLLMAVLTDVTARRLLEAQLRQAQKMESVGMLAGGVAHDFNNLLTIISGYSQLILNSLKPGDPNHYSAEQILKAGERAATLTQQLLTFSRPQVLQPKVVDRISW